MAGSIRTVLKEITMTQDMPLRCLKVTELPHGSKLSVRERRQGVEVRFDNPAGYGIRFMVLIVLLIPWWILWLFAIAVTCTMIFTLVQGKAADTTGQILGVAFLAIWLAGWGYGGMVLTRRLYRILKGREVLFIEPHVAWYRSGKPEDEPPVWRFWGGGIHLDRAMMGGIRIETGDLRRLVLTVGSRRVSVGERLDDKDLQWLRDLLNKWLTKSSL